MRVGGHLKLGNAQLVDARGSELLLQILTEREEKASAVASTLPFSEWGQIIPDPRLVAATSIGSPSTPPLSRPDALRQNESVLPNKVRYFRIPGIGPGKSAHEGTWADVLEVVPYFLMPGGPIPPRELVNEVLKLGVVDAGMSGGCEWDTTELDEESYNGVVHELLARPPQHVGFGGGQLEEVGSYKQLPVPPWVRTQSDFTFWSVEIARGVPALVHLDLSRRIDELVQAASDAYKIGDQLQQDRLEAALVEAEEEVAELWRRTDRWRKKVTGGPDHVARRSFDGRRRWS